MGMESIKITLETLYDILRNEKKRDELQKLEETFYIDVVGYLKEKTAILNSKKVDVDIFASGEKDKIEYEIRSIKRILKDIYEKREKKLLDIALNKSHTGSDLIDTSSMLREEKLFYQQLLNNLDNFRRGILLKIHRCEFPDILSLTDTSSAPKFSDYTHGNYLTSTESESPLESQSSITKFESEETEGELAQKRILATSDSKNNKIIQQDNSSDEQEKVEPIKSTLSDINLIKIKFLHPTPKFIWKDMKEYGPFDPGEQTDIFPEVADLLVRKGRAEKV